MNNKIQHKVSPPKGMVILTLDQWKEKAESIFGKGSSFKTWKFKCASCGQTQTMQEFIDAGVENPDQKVFFSCIGRYVKGRGCDWTLGGLLQIHETEVTNEDGKNIAVFEFAETPD